MRRSLVMVMGACALLIGLVVPAAGAAVGDVTGTVTLEGGGPLADVEVFLIAAGEDPLITCTDANGQYTFTDVTEGVDLRAGTGTGTKGTCRNWRFLAPDGEPLLSEFYDGHSGVVQFVPDTFQVGDGPIDFSVERAAGRDVCFGLLATVAGASDGDDVLMGTAGPDVIVGRRGDDVIRGLGGDDVLCGNHGRDRITPGTGVDYVNGGGGSRDWVDYSTAGSRVVVSLRRQVATGQGRDTIVGIENIMGSPAGDRLVGNARRNRIMAGAGADTVLGKKGNDLLWGNRGADTLLGGDGIDVARGGAGADDCTAETEISC